MAAECNHGPISKTECMCGKCVSIRPVTLALQLCDSLLSQHLSWDLGMSEQSIKPVQQCQEPPGLPMVESLMDLHGNMDRWELARCLDVHSYKSCNGPSTGTWRTRIGSFEYNPQFIAQSGPALQIGFGLSYCHDLWMNSALQRVVFPFFPLCTFHLLFGSLLTI